MSGLCCTLGGPDLGDGDDDDMMLFLSRSLGVYDVLTPPPWAGRCE